MMFNILLVLIFIRPFISSLVYPSLDMYYSYLLIFLSLLIIKSKKVTPKSFSGQGYLILFFLAIILAAFLSLQPFKSQPQLTKFLSYFFIFYAIYYMGEKEKKRIILTLILAASCVSIYAIYWFYIGSPHLLEYMQEQKIIYPFAQELLGRHRAFRPFILPSMLAGYLIMMLPLSLSYLLNENIGPFHKFSKKKMLQVLPTLLIAFALLLTKSLGASLSIFLSFLIFAILVRLFSKKIIFLLLSLLLILISIFILRSYKTEYFISPLFSIHNRFIYWQKTFSLILKHPFRGAGLGNLPFIQSQFTHNSYLQIWAEIGLLGIISFIGFLYNSFKNIQQKKLSTDKLYAGLIIAHLTFLIHNLIDFSFFLPEVCFNWWIISALFLSPVHTLQET